MNSHYTQAILNIHVPTSTSLLATVRVGVITCRGNSGKISSYYRGGGREKSRERMIHFPKLAQNHTHHQIFSIFWIFSTQIFDTHPYFFHYFPSYMRNLKTPPNFFAVIRLTLVKSIKECPLSIFYLS